MHGRYLLDLHGGRGGCCDLCLDVRKKRRGDGLVWFDGGVVVTACSRLVVVFDRRLDFGERAVTCILVGWQQQT